MDHTAQGSMLARWVFKRGRMGIYKGQDLFISLDGLIDGLFLELIKLAIQI